MPDRIQMLIELALQEDIGTGDITADALFPDESIEKEAVIVAKQELILAGLEIAKRVFLTVDHHLKWERYCEDGQKIAKGAQVAKISGRLKNILRAERTALNFLQHLSGIATQTCHVVEKVKKYSVQILDTRKTTPGMRALEKHAVRMGGGKNHRLGLFDRFLIKDNHLKNISISEAIQKAKQANPHKVAVEVEIQREGYEKQIEEALQAGADILLMDNFSPKELKKAVQIVKDFVGARLASPVLVEASGGICLENVEEYAQTGVDTISMGSLTHSAAAADLSLEVL